MKIAFFRMSALGDCVLATAAVNAIIEKYPQCEMTWITTPVIADMLSGMPKVKFLIIEKPRSILDYWNIYRKLRGYKFDILLCAQASLRANFIYPLIRAVRKIGFDDRRARDGHNFFVTEQISPGNDHLAEGFMRFAELLGAQSKHYKWYIDSNHNLTGGGEYPVFLLNVSASKKERNWHPVNYAELIYLLDSNYKCKIVLIGANSELDRSQELEILALLSRRKVSNLISLVGLTTLNELISSLQSAAVLISPDSGPVHIANALGVPVVGLYAVARPELSGPYQALQFTVNKYPQAVSTFLGKDVTEADWHERVHSEQAMSLIQVNEVFNCVELALHQRLNEQA